MKYIFDLHKTLHENHLILVYEGEFTQEITKSVLAMAERNMDSSGEEAMVKRKVFNVMVECLQNIVKHADNITHNHSAVFMIGKQAEKYVIISGNPIANNKMNRLKEKLNEINRLDKDGLKQLYKDIIRNTEISDKGGAGLGFVDMARKSGNNLNYDFIPFDEGDHSFFCLKASIDRK